MNWYHLLKLSALPPNWMEPEQWNHHVQQNVRHQFPDGPGTSHDNPHGGPNPVLMPGTYQHNYTPGLKGGTSVDFEVTAHFSRYCIHLSVNIPMTPEMQKSWGVPFNMYCTVNRDCPKSKERWSSIMHKRYEEADVYTPLKDARVAIESDAGCKDFDHNVEDAPLPHESTPVNDPQLVGV